MLYLKALVPQSCARAKLRAVTQRPRMPPRARTAVASTSPPPSEEVARSLRSGNGAIETCALLEAQQLDDVTRVVSVSELADAPFAGHKWTAIGGVVYDIGAFIESETHPGGTCGVDMFGSTPHACAARYGEGVLTRTLLSL